MTASWQFSTVHKCICKVIEEQSLWGQMVCRVWLPNQDTVVRIPKSALQPLDAGIHPHIEANRISYIASAAKVAEILEGGSNLAGGPVLLAAMESNVIPLPHQIHALSRIVSGNQIRYLLADEVGLGKTIEAGLAIRELKLRGLVRRILVVAPKGLATQWVSEMKLHFNETFQLIVGEDITALQRLNTDSDAMSSPWSMFNQIIVSLDSVKPLDKRRGWSQSQIATYNRTRFEDLMTAGWDLVIVDEAHRLGGSTDQVARYKLGKGLAEAAPYVLLLSATPHQGKSDAFQRIMSLLDPVLFSDAESISRDNVAPFIIRTEKRRAIDADARPLFKPRRTQMAAIKWETRHSSQKLLYEAVGDYVRDGYNQAVREKKPHLGFLMILMQRLVVSSTRAIKTTLQRRLDVLKSGEKETSELLSKFEEGPANDDDLADVYDMNPEELLEELLKARVSAMKNESAHVETLLDAASKCEIAGPDAKAEALIEWIYKLQSDENEQNLKVLIFTEFVPTQEMLRDFLEARSISVVTLNGSMNMSERKAVQDNFRNNTRVLISTDAGGEGLNLQFCHVIVNYDIPWNPMRLEQRIGRVDRIGQPKTVQAINFLFEESVEYRVREVLEQKLAVIFAEFGIDKTGDVLDSARAGELFGEVFTSAILYPTKIEQSVDRTINILRQEVHDARQSAPLFGVSDEPDVSAAERLRSHPLPHWLERMTIGYVRSHGGDTQWKHGHWDITWPDGKKQSRCVFRVADKDPSSDFTLLNLENSSVRGLAINLPQVASAQPLPIVSLNDLPSNVSGIWGLFEVRIQTTAYKESYLIRIPTIRRKFIAVFLSDERKVFLPTARHVWDSLQASEVIVSGTMNGEDSERAYVELIKCAEQSGQEAFSSSQQQHLDSIKLEEQRGEASFASRRKAIDRVGLPEVRTYRMNKCQAEEDEWRKELLDAKQTVPEIRPLLLMRILKGDPP